MPHLFVDISAHGFGHLAQVAPVLNALATRLPDLRLTLRSGLSSDQLHSRITTNFIHLHASSDFGYRMLDAVQIDRAASASAYRVQHTDWASLVATEAALLKAMHPDLVLTDVAYLPLAGAAVAGIPALAMSSLNWADLFAHYFAAEPWAVPIHRQMLAAYNSAECFLRLSPGMPMRDLLRIQPIGSVAELGHDCRGALRKQLGCSAGERLVLIAFGGFSKRLPIESWPSMDGTRWLVPDAWQVVPQASRKVNAFEPLGWEFTDLLRAVDAVITKPGYGTFAEAACNGTPVLYVRRDDWPEQDCLIDWLKLNARCCQISAADLLTGCLAATLGALWQQPAPPAPSPTGAAEAAEHLFSRLTALAGNQSV